MSTPPDPAPAAGPPDANALLRDPSYLRLLLLGALIGAPIAFVAYFFLRFVSQAQKFVYTTLPKDVGFTKVPAWWPIAPLMVGGLIVALAIQYLPGTAGHKPAEGFQTGGGNEPINLWGIIVASLATLCLGAVLGPEAPLIAIGGGLGVLAIHLVKKDAPAMAAVVIGGAGSFAAIATLLGSPIVAAFLMMEAVGIGGPLLGVLLVPGLLAAGIGALIFVGLNSWTGYGTYSLSIGHIPPVGPPTAGEFLWAIGIGIAAALLGTLIKRGALALQPVVEKRKILLTPLVGLGRRPLRDPVLRGDRQAHSYILFSGQAALPHLVQHAALFSVGALVMLIVCKGAAYGLSLSSFRGGPIFPGMFIGAALGIALSHLPGLPLIAGVGMGIGAMTVAMLGLPLVSVLLAALLLSDDGLRLTPLIIVAVVVSYVLSARLKPVAAPAAARLRLRLRLRLRVRRPEREESSRDATGRRLRRTRRPGSTLERPAAERHRVVDRFELPRFVGERRHPPPVGGGDGGGGHAVQHDRSEDRPRGDLGQQRECPVAGQPLDGQQREDDRRQSPGPEPPDEQRRLFPQPSPDEGDRHRAHPDHGEAQDRVDDRSGLEPLPQHGTGEQGAEDDPDHQ